MEFSAQPHRTDASGHTYDEQSVVVLSGVEAIRKRPSMYIGSTGAEGMHHLLFELVENAVDEFLAGHCRNIRVVLHADGSCAVTDDGRGIPVALHPRENRPTAEILLTDLHSGGKFKGDAYYLSGGVHGLGLTCVNALSEWLTLQVWRDRVHYSQEFRRGVPGREAREPDATSSRRGTSIRFRPDREIFGGEHEFSYEKISARLRELAYLNSGVTLLIEDERGGLGTEHHSTSGLVGFVESVNRNRAVINQEPIYCRGARGETVVEAAIQWTTSYAEEIYSFVNSVRTSRGGSHVEGLTRALTAVVNRHAAAPGDALGEITPADILEGLGAVLSVRAAGPQFDSQAKSRLVSPEVADVVESVLADALSGFFAEPSESARRVLARVLDAQHARLAARRMAAPSRYSPQDVARSLEIYRKQFGIRSKNWHDSCRWLTDDHLLSAHVEMCAVGPQARMLDVCCGSGIVGGSFAGRVGYRVGLDITPEMRALAGTRLDEVREGSVYEMSFEDNSFDLVVTREVLHLLPQPRRPLSEILRVLRPGGQLIFGQTVPYGEADAAWMFRIFKKKQPLFCNNFLAEDLEQLLGECGFRNVEIREYLQWEDIDLWIDTHETSALHRQEIRELYYNAPEDVREVHPFEVAPDGKIKDRWRWCIYSARKPE
ncbi:MAG TPA: methyltransferase domain-containing protein [Pyrinomonadaceae bacterium]|jgi:DNA gyrase subunit B